MNTKEYYKEQIMGVVRAGSVWGIAGAVIGMVFGIVAWMRSPGSVGFLENMGDTIVVAVIIGILLFGIPVGIQMSRKFSDMIGHGILVLPIVGWLLLWIVKLAIIFYGGWIGTIALLLYYLLRMLAAK